MMKPKLVNKPPYQYRDLKISFADGKPLSCDQLNFIFNHEKTLSSHGLDSLLRYYSQSHSYLMPSDKLDQEAVQRLKRQLKMLLAADHDDIRFTMKPEQFLQFRAITVNELILYHGNQMLTGAPFYQGGIPYTLYFQWGNLFGVAKYVVLAEEKALKSNALIYFESMHERYLDQCVLQFQHRYKDEKALVNELSISPQLHHAPLAHSPAPVPVHNATPAAQHVFQLPRMTLSINPRHEEDQK